MANYLVESVGQALSGIMYNVLVVRRRECYFEVDEKFNRGGAWYDPEPNPAGK